MCAFGTLQGLADDVENVREVAMRSGRAIVYQHALSHAAVLVPALRDGLLSSGVCTVSQVSLYCVRTPS